MESYKKWVRENKDYVHSFESLANGLTWLLPERFSSSEIGPEAVTAVLGIITAINEHIIDTTPTHMHLVSAEPSSFPYSLCISAIKDLETLIEVAAEQYYGNYKKWNFIALTEAIKVVVRLALFRNSGYKMLLHGGETPNEENHMGPSTSEQKTGSYPSTSEQKTGSYPNPGYLRNSNGPGQWNFLEGRAKSALSRFGESARMVSGPVWLQRVQHQHSIMAPPIEKPNLSTVLSAKGRNGVIFLTGEVLFIARPLIYVLLIRKYGIRSWIPWFLSLAMDFTWMGILSYVSSAWSRRKDQLHLSNSEKDEVKRRKMLWALYLMRDPFFSKYTRHRLENTVKILEPVPIIGFLTEKIVDLIVGAQTRYTYMSGS